jgi:hypothetical protein
MTLLLCLRQCAGFDLLRLALRINVILAFNAESIAILLSINPPIESKTN